MNGRVLVRTPEQAERLSISWRQLDTESEILLTGPLGTSIARISGQQGEFVLERPNAEPLIAASLDELVNAAIGIELPVSAAIPVLSGERQSLRYLDWRLNVVEFDQQGRPAVVNIVNGTNVIRLQVQSWR